MQGVLDISQNQNLMKPGPTCIICAFLENAAKSSHEMFAGCATMRILPPDLGPSGKET